MTSTDPRRDETDEGLDRKATALFIGTSIVTAIVIGAMLVSGWKAGSLDNRVEWIYWAGAILGGVGIGCLGIACLPGRTASQAGLVRAGLLLFLIAPVLCVIAVFAGYWI